MLSSKPPVPWDGDDGGDGAGARSDRTAFGPDGLVEVRTLATWGAPCPSRSRQGSGSRKVSEQHLGAAHPSPYYVCTIPPHTQVSVEMIGKEKHSCA